MGIERIIVPVDFSDHAAAAAELAAGLARRNRAGVTLLHVDRLPGGRSTAEPPPHVPADAWQRFARDREASLAELLAAMQRSLGEGRFQSRVVHGETSAAVLSYANECEADLIVMGSHGAAAPERFLLGSVAAGVAGLATCPVLITRTHHRARLPKDYVFRNPLVAVDDAGAVDGAGSALRLLADDAATIDLAPGWTEIGLEKEAAERKLGRAAASSDLERFDCQLIASTRRPTSVLLERLESGANDLVIVPARSAEREGLIGVIADRVLHHSPVPVLIPATRTTAQDS